MSSNFSQQIADRRAVSGRRHNLRKSRRRGNIERKKLSASSGLRLAAVVLASGLAVVFTQVAIIGINSNPYPWMLPALTVALMLIIIFTVIWHSRKEELPLQRRHHLLAGRMELLEDRTFELKESEETHRSLCDAFGDAIVHRDLDGNITFANQAFCRVFQTDLKLITGNRPAFLPPVDVAGFAGNADAVIRDIRPTDVALKTIDGERWFSWLDLPIRDENSKVSGYRSVARDISDRKLHEQTLAAAQKKAESHSSAKSRFLATVSHEIRTPMNGILGMSQLLAETDLSPAQNNYNLAIQKSGNALLHLIEDILDVAKIEADRFELETEPVNLRELAEEVTELLATRMDPEQINIAAHVAAEVPHSVMVDRGRLRQVLINLVGNAVKFTESGAVSLEITSSSPDAGQHSIVEFAVRDSGPGLSEKDSARIFDEFEQVGEDGELRKGGAGLGLTISQRIVEAMGSTITISSKTGSGSCFRFQIEVERVHPGINALLDSPLRHHGVAIYSTGDLASRALKRTLEDLGADVLLSRQQSEVIRHLERPLFAFRSVLFDHSEKDELSGIEFSVSDVLMIAIRAAGADDIHRQPTGNWLLKPIRTASLINVLTRNTDIMEVRSDIAKEQTSSVQQVLNPPSLEGPLGSIEHERSLNVLLAEDNEINVLLVRSKLQTLGHSVSVAENGEIAIENFSKSLESGQREFDLILMDMHMPKIDGLQAIRAIREQEYFLGTNQVPIIVLSADEQQELHNSALAAGANGFVTKPISLDRLMETIETCKRNASRSNRETIAAGSVAS